jgi:hypothetical protein
MRLARPFDGFVEYAKRVSPTCLVHLERNRYSVPASFANRPVSVRVYPERIVVVAEGQIVCEHRRVFARSHERKNTTTVYDWRHYLAVVQRKPGALRNGAPFTELPPAFRALQQRMHRVQLLLDAASFADSPSERPQPRPALVSCAVRQAKDRREFSGLAHPSGIPALRRPSITRSQNST